MTAEGIIANTLTIVHVQHKLLLAHSDPTRPRYVFPSSTHILNTFNQRHAPEQGIPKPRVDGRGNEAGEERGTRLEQ